MRPRVDKETKVCLHCAQTDSPLANHTVSTSRHSCPSDPRSTPAPYGSSDAHPAPVGRARDRSAACRPYTCRWGGTTSSSTAGSPPRRCGRSPPLRRYLMRCLRTVSRRTSRRLSSGSASRRRTSIRRRSRRRRKSTWRWRRAGTARCRRAVSSGSTSRGSAGASGWRWSPHSSQGSASPWRCIWLARERARLRS